MSAPSNNTDLRALQGPGPICAALSVLLPAGLLAFMIATFDGQAVPLVAALAFILFLQAALAARSDAVSIAIAFTGFTLGLSDASFLTMAIAGATLFLTFVLHDLSLSLRRQPAVSTEFVRGLASTTAGVIIVGWILAGAAFVIANLTVWPALVVPVAIVAVGLFVFIGLQQLIDNSESSDPKMN